MSRFAFGPFVLDTESRALLRDGERLPVAGRTLDTLVVLVKNRGRLLEKDELLSLIWPETVVEESNLSQSIFTLRKLLGDSPKHNRYIATVAGRGYQFVAPATELPAETRPFVHLITDARPETGLKSTPTPSSTRRSPALLIAAIGILAIAAGVVFWAILHRPARPRSELVERRLTFDSSASEVTSAVISPDGKYLAYSDPAGIHVRLISTGEERLIPTTKLASADASSWVDCWFPNGTELLGHSVEAGGRTAMWAISIMGQSSRELRAGAFGWSVSPDGARIAFSPVNAGVNQPELWIMDEHGEHAKKILVLPAGEFLWSARWSPDGQRLAYIRMQPARESLETCDLKGANRAAVIAAWGLGQWVRSLWWLPDNRIVYSRAEVADVDANLWQIRMNTRAGTPVGEPERITHWSGVDVLGLNASADGRRLVLRKESSPSQIYIGELGTASKRVQPPRRLTNDEAFDWATAWTADSKAVLFTSDRGGKWGIFKQVITQDTAEPLIQGRENANLVRLGPDGSWVLYSETSLREPAHTREYRLMRLPVNGGSPRLIYEDKEAELQDYPCARAPANLCVMIVATRDHKRLIVSAFDPLKGKGQTLRAIEKGAQEGFAWALSPDGSVLALAKANQRQIDIRLLSLTGGPDRNVAVKNWTNIGSMDWAPDGKGLYCGSVTPQNGTLLYVDLKGNAQVVAESKDVGGGPFVAGVPSPNGRYLALTGAIHYSNAWLLEGF